MVKLLFQWLEWTNKGCWLLCYPCGVDVDTFATHMEFNLYHMDIEKASWMNTCKRKYIWSNPKFWEVWTPWPFVQSYKALYELKLAQEAWYDKLSPFILDYTYNRDKIEYTLFFREQGKRLLIV